MIHAAATAASTAASRATQYAERVRGLSGGGWLAWCVRRPDRLSTVRLRWSRSDSKRVMVSSRWRIRSCWTGDRVSGVGVADMSGGLSGVWVGVDMSGYTL